MMLFISDLDNTLIHSVRRTSNRQVCVEEKNGEKVSFMSQKSYDMLQFINEKMDFIPITTRSLEQYRRIRLLKEKIPKYALTTNGGILLVEDKIDKDWQEESKELANLCEKELKESIDILKMDKNIILEPQNIDQLFIFAKTKDIKHTENILERNLDLDDINIEKHRNKIYIIPKELNKGRAIKRIKERFGYEFTIGAGDSMFDLPMLQIVDIPVVPFNSFLHNHIDNRRIIILNKDETNFTEGILEYIVNYNNIL